MSKDNLNQLEQQVDQQIKDAENARKERVMSGDESALKEGEYVEMNGKVIMGEKTESGFVKALKWIGKYIIWTPIKFLFVKLLWPIIKELLLAIPRLLGFVKR